MDLRIYCNHLHGGVCVEMRDLIGELDKAQEQLARLRDANVAALSVLREIPDDKSDEAWIAWAGRAKMARWLLGDESVFDAKG